METFAAGLLQAIFLLALTWFIKLLISFSKTLKEYQKDVNEKLAVMDQRIDALEKEQAVVDERWKNFNIRIDKFETSTFKKLDEIERLLRRTG